MPPHRTRPAEPHEVIEELAAVFLAAATVPRRRPPTARRVLRGIAAGAAQALIGLPLALVLIALLAHLTR
ncbi:hypothetical protein [Nocardiopsis composta]|uniref:Uncharacterized protein n=1 Tax=Nocardiopsis composta TaxID=157465 RepID=A0A7W8QTJ1_9ACTN|nr:hypothetical protein [Nocardiopsis composta]MBB5436312.1 hypothetical protein [Nocardiopsis composta]